LRLPWTFLDPAPSPWTQTVLPELAVHRPDSDPTEARAFQPGVVLDYELVNSSGSFTACGDKTYWISGPVILDQFNLEGGAVLKFDTEGRLTVGGLDCRTSSYHPAVFTSKHDNSLGDPLPGSSGSPSGNGGPTGCDYAGPALTFDYARFHNALDLHDLQCRFAGQGLVLGASSANTVKHVQFVKCAYALTGPAGCSFYLGNALFDTCFTACNGQQSSGRAEHLTLFHTYSVNYSSTLSLVLANSLLVGVPYPGNYTTPAGDVNQVLAENPSAPVFQTVGAGKFYLLDDTYRNQAGAAIDPVLREELKTKTTQPPQPFTGSVTARTVLKPQSIPRPCACVSPTWPCPAAVTASSTPAAASRN
jgi:hypothetical protein